MKKTKWQDRQLAAQASRLIRQGKREQAKPLIQEISDPQIKMKSIDQYVDDVPINERDLNSIQMRNHTSAYFPETPSVIADGDITVHFRDLADSLIQYIEEAPIVLGCVAWLTHPYILRALSGRQAVQIVVQKEDFLRPDYPSGLYKPSQWKSHLQMMYSLLPKSFTHSSFVGTKIHRMANFWESNIEPIRCIGYAKGSEYTILPRMHHKFVLFCTYGEERFDGYNGGMSPVITPYKVWTGSFNFTNNAARSLENAIVTSRPEIVRGYYEEYIHALSISESLNWSHEWAAPEWGIDMS